MQGPDIYRVLQSIGATHLHHANSVMTSCTFLEQGGLLSRGFVEDHHLQQTAQYTDQDDRKYAIWHLVFVDHVDIHERGGRSRGPNKYGPVLFVLDLDILLHLPAGTDIAITKKNPSNWRDNEANGERWFENLDELAKNIHFGDFDKMLMIHIPSNRLNFPNHQANMILDNPQRKLSSGEDAYAHAAHRLMTAAAHGNIQASIEQRQCKAGCICIPTYSRYTNQKFDLYFS